jgi:hypothetical protein
MTRIKNLIYGWRADENGITNFMLGAWWADEPPGGTAVRIHLVPPKNLLREDELVFDQNAAIVFVHDHVLKPLQDVGRFTDIMFEKRKVTVSLVPAARRIKYLEEPAAKLDLRPWKIEKIETLRNLARWRWDSLWNRVSSSIDPYRAPEDKAELRALKRRKSPGSFTTRAGLDRPRLDAKKVMEGLAWLDKELQKFPVEDVGLYLNVHPVQRYVNFEAFAPDHSFGGWLSEPVNEQLAEHFGFDIEDARRIPAVLWRAGIVSAPHLPRIELTDDH